MSVYELGFQLFLCWLAGFFGGLIIVIPFIGVKNVLDVSSAASGEIRGA